MGDANDIERAKRLHRKAWEECYVLFRANGKSWRKSTITQKDDTDIFLAEALNEMGRLIKELETCRERNAQLENLLREARQGFVYLSQGAWRILHMGRQLRKMDLVLTEEAYKGIFSTMQKLSQFEGNDGED